MEHYGNTSRIPLDTKQGSYMEHYGNTSRIPLDAEESFLYHCKNQ